MPRADSVSRMGSPRPAASAARRLDGGGGGGGGEAGSPLRCRLFLRIWHRLLTADVEVVHCRGLAHFARMDCGLCGAACNRGCRDQNCWTTRMKTLCVASVMAGERSGTAHLLRLRCKGANLSTAPSCSRPLLIDPAARSPPAPSLSRRTTPASPATPPCRPHAAAAGRHIGRQCCHGAWPAAAPPRRGCRRRHPPLPRHRRSAPACAAAARPRLCSARPAEPHGRRCRACSGRQHAADATAAAVAAASGATPRVLWDRH